MSSTSADDVLVQYIVVRGDLKYGVGALCAQAAHASTAATFRTLESSDTAAYLQSLESMHKIVLKADGEASLRSVADALTAAGVHAHLWTEQPEGVPTALATSPAPRSRLKPFFGDFKLFR